MVLRVSFFWTKVEICAGLVGLEVRHDSSLVMHDPSLLAEADRILQNLIVPPRLMDMIDAEPCDMWSDASDSVSDAHADSLWDRAQALDLTLRVRLRARFWELSSVVLEKSFVTRNGMTEMTFRIVLERFREAAFAMGTSGMPRYYLESDLRKLSIEILRVYVSRAFPDKWFGSWEHVRIFADEVSTLKSMLGEFWSEKDKLTSAQSKPRGVDMRNSSGQKAPKDLCLKHNPPSRSSLTSLVLFVLTGSGRFECLRVVQQYFLTRPNFAQFRDAASESHEDARQVLVSEKRSEVDGLWSEFLSWHWQVFAIMTKVNSRARDFFLDNNIYEGKSISLFGHLQAQLKGLKASGGIAGVGPGARVSRASSVEEASRTWVSLLVSRFSLIVRMYIDGILNLAGKSTLVRDNSIASGETETVQKAEGTREAERTGGTDTGRARTIRPFQSAQPDYDTSRSSHSDQPIDASTAAALITELLQIVASIGPGHATGAKLIASSVSRTLGHNIVIFYPWKR